MRQQLEKSLREKEELLSQQIAARSTGDEAEISYTCPITLTLISDPVIAPDGQTYEKAALLQWAGICRRGDKQPTTPISRVAFNEDALPSNKFYKQAIESTFPIFKEIQALKKQLLELEKVETPVIIAPAQRQAVMPQAQEQLVAPPALSGVPTPYASSSSAPLFQRRPVTNQENKKIDIIVVGDSSNGIKFDLISKFVGNDSFRSDVATTIGTAFKVKTIVIDRQTIKLQLWDTTGQERYRAVITDYYKKAQVFLFIYDVNSRESFTNLQRWKEKADEQSEARTLRALVAGRCDSGQPQVSSLEGQAQAEVWGMPFFECSGACDADVSAPFKEMARDFIETELSNAARLPAR